MKQDDTKQSVQGGREASNNRGERRREKVRKGKNMADFSLFMLTWQISHAYESSIGAPDQSHGGKTRKRAWLACELPNNGFLREGA